MPYEASDIIESLNDYGELLVTLESGRELELHLHDTMFGDDEVSVQMSDGMFAFTADSVESMAYHTQSLEEIND